MLSAYCSHDWEFTLWITRKTKQNKTKKTVSFCDVEVAELFQSVDSDRAFLLRGPDPSLYKCTAVYFFVVNHAAFHVHGMSLIPNPCLRDVQSVPAAQSPGKAYLVKVYAVCIPSALEIKLH